MSRNMRPMEGQAPGTQPRTKINTSSTLLTPEENDTVFKMLGRKCQTLNTAVVQIYKTEGSAHSHWKKKHTGVVCFVKDSMIRSYFLRAYCLIKNELVWEHEVYDGMKIIKSRPFLLTFEGQDGHVGLNFVSEEECESFYRAVDMVIEARNRKKLEKRNRPKSQMAPNIPQSAIKEPVKYPTPGLTTTDSAVQLRNHSKIGTVSLTSGPAPPSAKNFLGLSGGHSNKDKKRKVTKADISTPTNFVHISHVGWHAEKGFDLAGYEHDEVLTNFFAKAGVSETQLKDRDTRAFIYDFLQSNNVLASVKSEREDKPKGAAPAPPPVPSRHQYSQHGQNGTAATTTTQVATTTTTTTSQRTAPPPPPPPARQPPPPVPTTAPGSARAPAPPIRPPPITSASTPSTHLISAPVVAPSPPPPPPPVVAPPPPPPPPPMPAAELPRITTTHAPHEPKAPSSLPVVDDTHNALMESIRKGTTLRKVDAAALSTGSGDSHSDLMSEIRMGIELRPAEKRELPTNRSSDDGAGTDALADALRRALLERGRVMQSSDEESESSANDDEWED